MRESLRRLMLAKAATGVPLNEYTAYGNPLSFNTNVAKPLVDLTIPFSPYQAGTGDPSPENVRSISGTDHVNVWRTGSNIFDISFLTATGITVTNGVATGTASSFNSAFSNAGISFLRFAENVQYKLECTVYTDGNQSVDSGTGIYFKAFYSDGTISNHMDIANDWTTPTKFSFKSINNKTLVAIGISYGSKGNNIWHISNVNLQPNETFVEDTPYSGSTYPVTFPVLTKNLLNPDDVFLDYRIGANGINYSESGYYASDFIAVETGATYYKNSPTVDAYHRWGTYSSANPNSFIRKVDNSNGITIEQGENYIRMCGKQIELSTAQVEKGSSSTPYEPYTNTVYGGNLDVTTGMLTVEWLKFSAKWGDFTYGADLGNNTRKTLTLSQKLQKDEGNSVCNVIKTYLQSNSSDSVHFYISQTGYTFYAVLPNDFDTDSVVEVCGKLKDSPITYQLTPQQITALIGDNVIWSDTNGSNTASYLMKG